MMMRSSQKKAGNAGYLRSALSVALGAGAVLGGSYFFSRLKEKRDAEARLDRLEQMLEQLTEAERKQ